MNITLEKFTDVSGAKQSGGFMLGSIQLKGFMRYTQDTIVELPDGLTVITGRTGSGKTSLLDAITFALYRRSTRTDVGAKMSDLCQPGGQVTITFQTEDDTYEITRGITTSGKPHLTLKKNDERINGSIRELEEIIQNTIGLDYDGFRNSTFVRQEEMRALGAETGSNRLEIFQKLFRLNLFEKAQEAAARELDQVKLDIHSMETEISVRREQLDALPEMQRSLKDDEKALKDNSRALDKLKSKTETLQKELGSLEKEHETFLETQTRMSELQSNLEEVQSKLDKAQKDQEQQKELKDRITQLETDTKEYEKTRKQETALRDKQGKHAALKEKEGIYSSQKESLNKEHDARTDQLGSRLSKEEERVQALSTTVNQEEAFVLLRSEGGLMERLARIDKELDWLKDRQDILEEIKSEQEAGQIELEDVKAKVSEINADSFRLSEIQNNISRIKQDLEEEQKKHQTRLKDVETQLKDVCSKIDKLGFRKEDEKRLKELKEHLKGLEKKKKELEGMRKKMEALGDITRLIQDLENRKDMLKKKLPELQKQLKKLQKQDEKYQQTKAEIEQLRQEEQPLSRIIHEKQGAITQIKERIAELKEVKAQITNKEGELEEMRACAEVLTLLKERIFHRRGVPLHAINQLLPQLSLETSTNLAELTDSRLSKVHLEPYEESRGYGIHILVEAPDKKFHDVQEFSGGERTQINAAIRFAIARELANMPVIGRTYAQMSTLFIDEGDLGSLDTESSRALFVNKLFDMGRFFDKLILITHLTEVAEKFPHRINVDMTPDGVSRVEVIQ